MMRRAMNYEVQGKKVRRLLCIKMTIQGMARKLDGDYERNINAYYRPYQRYYFSRDGARRDEDGHYYITGHVHNAINVKRVSIRPTKRVMVRVKGMPCFVYYWL